MLRGPRVRLRAPEREDIPRMHEMMARENELVMLGGWAWQPHSRARFEKWWEKDLEAAESFEFVIEADGKVIGDVGLQRWAADRRSGTSPFGIGIVDPDYVGKGYGREALQLLLEWAFVAQNFRRIWLNALAINERAVRMYRACGFVQEGVLREDEWCDGRFADIVVMGLLRREWEAGRALAAGTPAWKGSAH